MSLFPEHNSREQDSWIDGRFASARGLADAGLSRTFEGVKCGNKKVIGTIALNSFPELKERIKSKTMGYAENVFARLAADRLRSTSNHFRFVRSVGPLYFAASDSELCDFAERIAEVCAKIIAMEDSPEFQLGDVFEEYGFNTDFMEWHLDVETGELAAEGNWIPRATCARFWRRKVRKLCNQKAELLAREIGLTHKKAGCYVSDFTFHRWAASQRRNQLVLEGLEATNDRGQVFGLDELAGLGVSDLGIRRGELMCRIRGFEEWSDQDAEEWQPVLITLTAPSRFHSHTQVGGKYGPVIANPKYDGSTPRDAMNWHADRLARMRSRLQKRKLSRFGFRIVEPHHDGCPHMHVLYWIRPEQCVDIQRVITELWMEEWEPGADENRVDWKLIDREKGSAVGYVAKYISKNIDGYGVGMDDESGQYATVTALRVRAWATTWGFKQFSQDGGPSVTVWRELRRLANQPQQIPPEHARPEQLTLALEAADEGDWCEYTKQMGGAVCDRKDRPIVPYWLAREDTGIYGDAINYIRGLWADGFEFPLLTRIREWVISFKTKDRPKRSFFDQKKRELQQEAASWASFQWSPQAATLDLCQ